MSVKELVVTLRRSRRVCFSLVILFLPVFLYAPSLACAQTSRSTPAELAAWSADAREFLRAGQTLRAETLCRKILDHLQAGSEEEAAVVAFAMGDTFFRHMRYEESFALHSRGMDLLLKHSPGPDAAKRLLSTGNRYRELGMSIAAVTFYTQVGDWGGRDMLQEKAIQVAMAKSAMGNSLGAAATLRRSMKRHGDPKGQLAFQLAWVQLQAKQLRKALDGFLRVAREHPKTQWAGASLYYAANAYLTRKEPLEAKKLLEQFISDYPESDLSDEAKIMIGKIAEPS